MTTLIDIVTCMGGFHTNMYTLGFGVNQFLATSCDGGVMSHYTLNKDSNLNFVLICKKKSGYTIVYNPRINTGGLQLHKNGTHPIINKHLQQKKHYKIVCICCCHHLLLEWSSLSLDCLFLISTSL